MELPIDFQQFKRQQLDLQKQQRQKVRFIDKYYIYMARNLLFDSHLLYLSCNIVISVLGLTTSKVFYSFLLLDIIDRSTVLRNVIRSITQNSTQLIMTAILGIVLLYIYAIIGFYSSDIKSTFVYAGNDKLNVCDNAWRCFGFILNIGLRSGGGVGDAFNLPNPGNHSNAEIIIIDFFFFIFGVYGYILAGIYVSTHNFYVIYLFYCCNRWRVCPIHPEIHL